MDDRTDASQARPGADDRHTLREIARLITRERDEAGTGTHDEEEPANGYGGSDPDDGDAGPEPETSAQTTPGPEPLMQAPERAGFDLAGLEGLFDLLPAGVALCRGRDLIHANSGFAYAFGYRDAQALAAAGGLEAIFTGNEALAQPAATVSSVRRVSVEGRTASGRRRPVSLGIAGVTAGGETLTVLLLDAADAAPATSEDTGAHTSDDPFGLAESVADGTVTISNAGRILDVSAKARSWLEVPNRQLVGRRFVELLPLEDRSAFAQMLDGLPADGLPAGGADPQQPPAAETTRISPAGLVSWPVTLTAVRDREHGRVRIVLRQREAPPPASSSLSERAHAPADPMQFLARVSHEVRTPLNSIIGFAELMRDGRFGPLPNTRYEGYVEDIHQSGLYALSLINDLLDISKIEAGRFDLDFTAVDVNELAGEVVSLMQPVASRERVVLRAQHHADVPHVLADRRRLKQILLNLISNAIKFTEAGGQAILSTAEQPGGSIRVRVRDTGVGMSEAEIAYAMEPFRQLETSPRKLSGTGLGLPLTKALVEANRAALTLESTPGEGTTIDVVFPKERVVAAPVAGDDD